MSRSASNQLKRDSQRGEHGATQQTDGGRIWSSRTSSPCGSMAGWMPTTGRNPAWPEIWCWVRERSRFRSKTWRRNAGSRLRECDGSCSPRGFQSALTTRFRGPGCADRGVRAGCRSHGRGRHFGVHPGPGGSRHQGGRSSRGPLLCRARPGDGASRIGRGGSGPVVTGGHSGVYRRPRGVGPSIAGSVQPGDPPRRGGSRLVGAGGRARCGRPERGRRPRIRRPGRIHHMGGGAESATRAWLCRVSSRLPGRARYWPGAGW